MTELKPCPFCGGEANPNGKVRYSPSYEGTWADGSKVTDAFFVNCIKCGADNRAHLGHQTKAQAIAAWNTRAAEEGKAELVEKAEALLHAVCGETGFAAAVRADSGVAYPWPALDIAEAALRAALARVRGEG